MVYQCQDLAISNLTLIPLVPSLGPSIPSFPASTSLPSPTLGLTGSFGLSFLRPTRTPPSLSGPVHAGRILIYSTMRPRPWPRTSLLQGGVPTLTPMRTRLSLKKRQSGSSLARLGQLGSFVSARPFSVCSPRCWRRAVFNQGFWLSLFWSFLRYCWFFSLRITP